MSSYYDEVALKGLQLAANDLERGVLNEAQLERIRESVKQLVADLDRHSDDDSQAANADADSADALAPSLAEQDPPKRLPPEGMAPSAEQLPREWQSESAVLCIAGRGPLDEAASEILAQLLHKHGFGAQVLPYEAASRTNIARLNAAGVAMICVSYLEISGSPSHLRYLMQRLRNRLPGRPILVGLWPAEDAVLKNPRIRSVVGADDYTTSLHTAVEACIRHARAEADMVSRPEIAAAPSLARSSP